ncbi:hypothetical protein PZT57_30640 [Pseudomonas aeruginosa]|uniref:cupin domain-containing protein n=1 Tax=Pseudomonas aeruginosa TaxID=287 RepID=UPI002B2705A1|nr:hypothetical protein [Pseudomonas aeruginosa]MEA8593007.1 hypothetical protein [Pseudomonas aeruginosa]
MKTARIENMTKGWFVGAFSPTAHHTNSCEVALKTYKAGETEEAHFHKIATETTLIVSGKVEMCDQVWGPGDIVVLEPGDITAFRCLEDTVTVVVKEPGALNDKYLMGE